MDKKTATVIAKTAKSPTDQLESIVGVDSSVDRLVAKHPSAGAMLLEKLSHSSDKATRKAVVLNPNTPKEILLALAPQFPGDFFQNPAFDWLLLEDPNLLFNLGQGVLKNILKRPECPESFLKWAVQHGDEQEKLAVVMNPNATQAILEGLTTHNGKVGEGAKSHKNSKFLVESTLSDNRDLVYKEIKIELSNLAPNEAELYWKRRILGPSKWSSLNVNDRLKVLDFSPWVFVDSWAVSHPDILIKNFSWLRPALIKVKSSQTNPAELERLSSNKSVEIRVSVAKESHTPHSVLVVLSQDTSVLVRQAVAENQMTPVEVLELLGNDKRYDVRVQVVSNPALPITFVEKLLKDKSSEVRKAAKTAMSLDIRCARSWQSPSDDLLRLAKAKNSDVRLAVALNPSSSDTTRFIAFQSLIAEAGPIKVIDLINDPNCPAELRVNVRANIWWRELRLIIKRYGIDEPNEILPQSPDQEALIQMLDNEAEALVLNPTQSLLAKALKFEEGNLLTIPDAEADIACNAKARAVRLMGLMHPKAGPDAMVKRSKSTDWVERLAIASNPACVDSILTILEKDANSLVSQQVAFTRALKEDKQEQNNKIISVALGQQISIKSVVNEINVRLRQCRPWLLQSTPWWDCLTFEQRLGVQIGKNIADEFKDYPVVLGLLALYKGNPVSGLIGKNEIWDKPTLGEARRAIAWSVLKPTEALSELVNDAQDDYFQMYVANNLNISSDVRKMISDALTRLANDMHNDYSYKHKESALNVSPLQFTVDELEKMSIDSDEKIRYLVAGYPTTSENCLQVLATDVHHLVRLNVARNPNATASALELLIEDTNQTIAEVALSNSNIPLTILERMSKNKTERIRCIVAENQSTPMKILEDLSNDSCQDVRRCIARNKCVSIALLDRLANDVKDVESYIKSLLNIARSRSTSPEVLLKLSKSSFWIIKFSVLENKNYPKNLHASDSATIFSQFILSMKTRPSNINDDGLNLEDLLPPFMALNLISNWTDSKWPAKAAKSKDWLARVASAIFPETQPSILSMLLDDEVEVIRQIAAKRLSDKALATIQPNKSK